MAVVQYGELVTNISGSMGGTTFSHNRYGRYIRTKSIPVNPNTARQQEVRNVFADVAEQWNSVLTQVQRDAWNLYGASVVMKNALSEDIFLTGFNHFIRSNSVILRAGLPLIADGPTTFSLPETDAQFACTASEAAQTISVVFNEARPWVSEFFASLLLFQMQPRIASREFLVGPSREIERVAGNLDVPPTSPQTPAVAFVTTEAQKMIVYGRILRADGRLSAPFQDTVEVAA